MSLNKIMFNLRMRLVLVWGLALPAGAIGVSSQVSQLPEVTVIGSKEAERSLPGSGSYVDQREIREKNYEDIHQVMRSVPGVAVRDEDGHGMFPHISLRGTDLNRSSKLTMMEDGVLIAPAPYTAPGAYFSPAVGKMSGVEVLKGSSQVKYGPHTIGGVLNYLSTAIPDSQQFYGKTLAGSFGEKIGHSYASKHFASRIRGALWLSGRALCAKLRGL